MSNSSNEPLPRSGFVLLGTVTLFWGLNFVVMKIVLDELTPWIFRTVCLSLGGLGLMVINRLSGVSNALLKSDLKQLMVMSFFMVLGWQLCSAYGLTFLPSGRAIIIAYTMPLWAAILGRILLKEKLTQRRILGLVIGLGGLMVLIGPDLLTFQQAPMGIVFLLMAAWCWAAGTVLFKRGPWKMPISAVMAWMFLIGGAPIFLKALIYESPAPLFEMSLRGSLALAYVIVLPMWFCHWAYYKVVQIFPVNLAAIGMLLTPPLGVIVSATYLGEPVGWRDLVSLILVVIALFIVMMKPSRGRAA